MTDMRTAPAPSMIPPQVGRADTAGAVGTTEPAPLTAEQLRGGAALATDSGRPQLLPPGAAGVAADAAGGVTATWRTNVQITALWTIDEVRNSWIAVAGLGWKKLYNGRDGAFLALSALAGQARQTGRNVSLREEADGMIYEIYLW